MLLSSFKNLQRTYLRDPLKYLELAFLSLMLLSLPSIEAPKNIFLILFLATSLYRQYLKKNTRSLETLGLDFFKLHRVCLFKCQLRWHP